MSKGSRDHVSKQNNLQWGQWVKKHLEDGNEKYDKFSEIFFYIHIYTYLYLYFKESDVVYSPFSFKIYIKIQVSVSVSVSFIAVKYIY